MTPKKDKSKAKVAGLAVVLSGLAAGGGFLIHRHLTRKYSFLKEQQIDIRVVPKKRLRQLLREDEEHGALKRIVRAKELFKAGDIDVAVFLAFSTWEKHLREMLRENAKGPQEDQGLCNLLKKLRSRGLIDRNQYEDGKFLIQHARNPVVHGEQLFDDKIADLAIRYVGKFIATHRSNKGVVPVSGGPTRELVAR